MEVLSRDLRFYRLLTGSYSVRESEDGFLLLETFDVKGGVNPIGKEIFIRIDHQDETLSIYGTSPFVRQTP